MQKLANIANKNDWLADLSNILLKLKTDETVSHLMSGNVNLRRILFP